MKHTGGADRGDGVIIHRGNRDLRKITCPKCRGLATVTRTADGHAVTKCHTCGAEYVSKPM
jgi:ribosomal protein S27E